MNHISELFNFKPPLRLIVTTKCNGRCGFCHKEGADNLKDMDMEVIKECADIAAKISLPNICITGGEPSLRTDLPYIINNIKSIYNGNISLTSNGCNLLDYIDQINNKIYKLNLSFTSFNDVISHKYQKVNSNIIKTIISNFPAEKINLNLVLVKDNYLEIRQIIDYCMSNNYSLDIMFELQSHDENLYINILKELRLPFVPYIDLRGIPKLVIYENGKCKICIKHPWLSSLVVRNACNACKHECYEHICAVRVYSDKTVSPCLNKVNLFSTKYLQKNIEDAYKFIDDSYI